MQAAMSTSPAPNCVLCGAPSARHFALIDEKRYWNCRTCGITFLDANDHLSPQEEQVHYRLHAMDPQDEAYEAAVGRLVSHLLPRLPAGALGLDYGCGPKRTLSRLMRQHDFVMSEYDPVFMDQFSALQGKYDFITCAEAVSHFRSPARDFRLLNNLLRPGGWIGLLTEMLEHDDAFMGWRYRRDPTRVVFYKPTSFTVIARRFGWRVHTPTRGVVLLEKAR
jgi:SAM-dependent methyltransferase